MAQKSEIVSFNEVVPELAKLLEIDGAELDQVLGGYAELESDCPNLATCNTFGDCNTKTSCIGRMS